MKISFNGVILPLDSPAIKTQIKRPDGIYTDATKNNIENFYYLKPLTVSEKTARKDLKEIEKLTANNGVFSLDKASELIKAKIDKQQMLYSEEDIKNVVKAVMSKSPKTTRQEVLEVLSDLSNFSNYESLCAVKNFCKENEISQIVKLKTLNLNSILSYFSSASKCFLVLPFRNKNQNLNRVIFADRETIKELKKQKNDDAANKFSYLKANIKNGTTKIAILDGFEANTKDGLKSFNFVGSWGNLADAALAVLEEKKSGKNPFTDDIVADIKELFGNDVNINILKNKPETLDEKLIAQRLNPKTISKEEIKKNLFGIAKYAQEISKNMPDIKNNTPVNLDEIQLALTKVLYPIIEVYSPRRIATELSVLNNKINETVQNMGKTTNDLLFVVPNTEKSFGLITYQYSKVANTQNTSFVYPNTKNTNVEDSIKKNKVFVFLDDFSSSGQSLVDKDLPYLKLKAANPLNPVIFAPIAFSKTAAERIEKAILNKKNELQRDTKDCLIGVNKIDEMPTYLKMLPKPLRQIIFSSKSCGYDGGMYAIAFPHVIPDNCSDIAGLLLKPILKSEAANKATINFQKECRILTLSKDAEKGLK